MTVVRLNNVLKSLQNRSTLLDQMSCDWVNGYQLEISH